MASVIRKVTVDFENRLNATESKLERALTDIQDVMNENSILASELSSLEMKLEKLNCQKPSKNTTESTGVLEDDNTETNSPGECLVDVMFALDGSRSIAPSDFKTMKRWVIAVARRINASYSDVQFGVMQYSHFYITRGLEDQPLIRTELRLGYYKDSEFDRSVSDIDFMGYTTYTAAALRKSKNDFVNSNNFNKSGNVQVLILITDGGATDRNDLTQSSQMLRDINVIPFAVGVGADVDTSELKIIAGEGLRVIQSPDFAGLQPNFNLERYITCDGSA